MKKNILLFFTLLHSMVLFSCNIPEIKTTKQANIQSFDLSPDDKYIVFAYQDSSNSIFEYDIIKDKYIKLFSSVDTTFYYPKYSSDKKNILFIGAYNKGGSDIFLYNVETQITRQLTFHEKNITDAIFSTNGHLIYFCKADTFANYSSMVSKRLHGMDIYSVSLINFSEQRITHFNSYNIGKLNNYSDSSLIFNITISTKKAGMFLINLNRPDNLIDVNPINNPREYKDLYYEPVYYSKDKSIAFDTQSELYGMDSSKFAKSILRNDTIDYKNIQFYHNKKRLIFIVFNRIYSDIQAINWDGSDLYNFNIKP